jgi:hypothetical protein
MKPNKFFGGSSEFADAAGEAPGSMGYQVEGNTGQPSHEVPPAQGPEKPVLTKEQEAELQEYHDEVAEFIDAYRPLFDTFAGDTSLQFKAGDAFYIDLKSGEVSVDVRWFKEKGFTKEQIIWACLHELSHFRDLADDPAGMKEVFSDLRKKARALAPVLERKWAAAAAKQNRPDYLDAIRKHRPVSSIGSEKEESLSGIEASAYKIFHTFANILDDVHVNGRVSRRVSGYAPGGSNEHQVVDLYREKLFKETDYSELPRHLQFGYAILRAVMVPEEEVVVSAEVQRHLNRVFNIGSKQYPVLGDGGLVDTFLRPSAKQDTRVSARARIIEATLAPIFEELLLKDIEEQEFVIPAAQSVAASAGEGASGDASANPFQGDYKDFESRTPDQIPEGQIEAWQHGYHEGKQQRAMEGESGQGDKKTIEQKEKESKENLDRAWAAQHGVSPITLDAYRRIEKEVAPYVRELSQFWEHIIGGKRVELSQARQGYFKRGELSVDEAINKWADITKDPQRAEVMERYERKETIVSRPELIRVRLSGDISTSMRGEKLVMLQRCFVLLLSSLREFETKLNLTRAVTKTSLQIDTEAWVFGHGAECVKHKHVPPTGSYDAEVEIVKIFEHLEQATGMSTRDDLVFKEISTDIASEREALRSGKVMELIFEVTDGGSGRPTLARSGIDQLEKDGAFVRAFQIGGKNNLDEATFQQVWNSGVAQPRGQIVGEDIALLLPAMVTALKGRLKDIKL